MCVVLRQAKGRRGSLPNKRLLLFVSDVWVCVCVCERFDTLETKIYVEERV